VLSAPHIVSDNFTHSYPLQHAEVDGKLQAKTTLSLGRKPLVPVIYRVRHLTLPILKVG